MSKIRFDEFEPTSEKAWKQKIQVDLKGKDYNETMLTPTDEGIDIKPFYHSDSHLDFKIPSPMQWFITKKIGASDFKDIDHLKSKGIEAFWLSTENSKDILKVLSSTENPFLINLKHFEVDELELKENLFFAYDPIGQFTKTGNWFDKQSSDLRKHQDYVNKTRNLSVDTRLYHDAGANIAQQLAYTVAHLNSYFKNLKSQSPKIKLNLLIFTAIGPNYFFEIAKLKALRLLVNTLCKNQNINYDLEIISEPGQHHMSIYDYNVNMLRSTTECMSAVLGGSDFVCNTTYDKIFKNKNGFSDRIAKNQLLIIKHESYFDKVENPADGTYYINHITKALAEKALDIFKGIEKSGGFIQQLFDGKIQEKIDQQFQKTLDKFKNKELKLVGVNIYKNEDEQMKNQLDKDIFPKKNKRKTLIKPITERRIAEVLEKERLAEEAH